MSKRAKILAALAVVVGAAVVAYLASRPSPALAAAAAATSGTSGTAGAVSRTMVGTAPDGTPIFGTGTGADKTGSTPAARDAIAATGAASLAAAAASAKGGA